MTEPALEQLIHEKAFTALLQGQARSFFQLSNTLLPLAEGDQPEWNKKHFNQLVNESDALETFLDDYGAGYNRKFSYLRELVASLRWFAHAGYSISHLIGRVDYYGIDIWGLGEASEAAQRAIESGLVFLGRMGRRLLVSIRDEVQSHGIQLTTEAFPESSFTPILARQKLPRNVGQEGGLDEEDKKVAEVATKFLQAAEMVADSGVRRITDREDRHRFFARECTETSARVYEATIHNLQSTYDTHIQNSVLEGKDARLRLLRGHASAALHLLETVTYMAHFIERHEGEIRSADAKRRIGELIDRSEVEDVTLNTFFWLAHRALQAGVPLAKELLPEYTNIQQLELELPGNLALHARPAALIVGIVSHYGTPVEMELGGHRANAGSILELLVAVGSHPGARRFLFRGDEKPLRDIQALFQCGLGETGLHQLPEDLGYLRHS
jgi:phosphotransferase system HPr-like phosphotransfer protein